MKWMRVILMMAAGMTFMAWSNGKYLISVAAWIFPVLFMTAVKEMSFRKAWVLLPLVTGTANQISFHHLLPSLDLPFFEYLPGLAGALYAIPYLLQKHAYQRSDSFIVTLLFPSAYTLLDTLHMYLNPYGSFGHLGYSQHQLLPVMQMASILGITGLTFLITWTAAVVFWLMHGEATLKKRRTALVMAGVLAAALTLGGLRTISGGEKETVHVAGLHIFDRTNEETTEIFQLQESDPSLFLEKAGERMDELIKATEKEAEHGAEIIHHSEGSVIIDESQKTEYLDRLREVAVKAGVYIITVPYIYTPSEEPNENVLYIIDQNGEIAAEHYKYGGSFVEQTVEGDGDIPYVDTPYGRIAGVICWDKDFPAVMDQVGEKNIDLLFVPSADWKEISPYHTIAGTFRGLENGAAVITQTVNGMSMITDADGRTLAEMDHFTADDWTMHGHVPVEGKRTFYTAAGQYFPVCIIIAVILLLYVVFIRKQRK
ncbi:hypothetical protein JF544_07470 [Halobacillus kuroshimensis]|uniref:CN hydrolase domain-containing protein n=1 Tax=Halobacillus kuroshimensis TaxID=302481 RepID=A0ABS3DUS2_9BACI|nr:nitrilase-related carbon-nitrogen hydrolase [Halobacillus kuroshimensis]MBN8235085.1 hypothetical protein [Halobacillus kuroshimensis]